MCVCVLGGACRKAGSIKYYCSMQVCWKFKMHAASGTELGLHCSKIMVEKRLIEWQTFFIYKLLLQVSEFILINIKIVLANLF